jgi:hypothetical protein
MKWRPCKDIPHDQHPDHQLRIDRWATHGRVMRCKFAAKPGKIESSVDLPHQMIFGNRVAKMKLVEQLTLVTLQTAHHGSTSPRFASTQRNHGSPHVSTDFCNKTDPSRTSSCYIRDARWRSEYQLQFRGFSDVPHSASPNVMRYGGNPSSMVRAACRSAVAKPSVNRS